MNGSVFIFKYITKEDVMKEMRDLDVSKASQENNIPTKIIQENAGIFSNFIYRALIKYRAFSNII